MKGLWIGHQNICHLLPKVEQIDLLLTKPKQEIDIFGVTETFLKKRHSNKIVNIDGYIIERRDRQRRSGGGVLVYIFRDYTIH